MKLLLLFTAIIISNAAIAQVNIIDKAKMRERAVQYMLSGKDTLERNWSGVVVPDLQVRILPQDHMPYLVPDTRGIAAMPNAAAEWKEPTAGRIPNPAVPPFKKEITPIR